MDNILSINCHYKWLCNCTLCSVLLILSTVIALSVNMYINYGICIYGNQNVVLICNKGGNIDTTTAAAAAT